MLIVTHLPINKSTTTLFWK